MVTHRCGKFRLRRQRAFDRPPPQVKRHIQLHAEFFEGNFNAPGGPIWY